MASSDFQLTLDENVHKQLLGEPLIRYDYLNRPVETPALVSCTNNHMFVNHTPEQRLILHNYCVDQSKQAGYPVDSKWNDETFLECAAKSSDPHAKNNAGMSYSDILGELHEKKRRPKSYKTSKSKSFTDVLRDLIGTQMNLLEQLNEFQTDNAVVDEISKTKRSRSTDSDRSETSSQRSRAKSAKKKKKKSRHSSREKTQ